MESAKGLVRLTILFAAFLLLLVQVTFVTASNVTQPESMAFKNEQKVESPTLAAVIQMMEDTQINTSQQQPNIPSPQQTQSIQPFNSKKQHSHSIHPQAMSTATLIDRFKLSSDQQKERTGKIMSSLQAAIRRARRDPTGQQKLVALEKAFSRAIVRVQNIRRSRRRRHRSRSSSRSANATNVRHRRRTRRSRSKSRSSSTNSSSSSSSSSNSNSFHLSWSSSTTDSSLSAHTRHRHHHRHRPSSSSSSTSTSSSTSSSSSSRIDKKSPKQHRHHKKHRRSLSAESFSVTS